MLEKKSLGLLRHTARTLLTGDLHHWQQFGTIFCHVHIRSRSEDATDTFSLDEDTAGRHSRAQQVDAVDLSLSVSDQKKETSHPV